MYKIPIAFICEIDNPFDINSLEYSGLGGSETWILNMAFNLCQMDYHVIIFNQNNYTCYNLNGIEILPISELELISTYITFEHVFINRYFDPNIINIFKENNNCNNLYFVLHDIRLWKANGEYIFNDLNNCLKYEDIENDLWLKSHIKKIFMMSKWHRDFNNDCEYPEKLVEIIGNGINIPTLDNSIKRDNNIFWSSCLERGFDDILINKIMPLVHQKNPNIKLYVSSYNPLPEAKYDNLEYVIPLGSLTKEQLYKEMQKHMISFLPLTHWETFCITSIEAISNNMELVCPFKYGLQTIFEYFEDLFIQDGDYENQEYCEYVANEIVNKIDNYYSKDSIIRRNILYKYVIDNYSWEHISKKLYNIISKYEKSNCNS